MNKEQLIRKFNNNLVTCGTGIIMFTIWSILKIVVNFTNYKKLSDGFDALLGNSGGAQSVHTGLLVLVLAVVILILLAQIYVGRNSIQMGKGLSEKKGFIAVAIILLVISVFSILGYAFAFNLEDIISNIISIIIEITQDIILVIIVTSAFKVQAFSKEKGE